MSHRNPRNGTWYSGMRAMDTAETSPNETSRAKAEPGKEERSKLPGEVEQLIERVGASIIADLRTLSEALNSIYAARLSARDGQLAEPSNAQIAELRQSLVAVQGERDALAARVEELQRTQHQQGTDALAVRAREAAQLRPDPDALAAHGQEHGRTRFQIVPTIAQDLESVSLAPPGAVSQGSRAVSSGDAQIEASPDTTAQLVIKAVPGSDLPGGTAVTLRPGAVVGRHSSDVQLDDAFMSAEHARLTARDGRWWITDLGSTNGTFVNGVRIDRPTPLSEGDEIRFGRVRTRFNIVIAQNYPAGPSLPSPSQRIRALSKGAGYLQGPRRNISAG